MFKLFKCLLSCLLPAVLLWHSAAACPAPGIYTVGPTGTYTSIAQVITDLNTCSNLTGAYVFELQAGYVSSVETFPLVIPKWAGASATNTVTFRPASGATNLLITNNSNGTLQLNGAQYVVFDGRPGGIGTSPQLTIRNTLAALSSAVLFINDASYNQLLYCNIQSAETDNNNSGTIFFSTTTGSTGNDHNLIDHCNIAEAGSTPANGIYAAGSSGSVSLYNSGNIISNNNIYNFYSSTTSCNGIYLFGANTDWTISGNSFYQTSTRILGSTRGISAVFIYNNISFGGNNFQVINNYVGGNSPLANGTMTITGSGNLIPFNFYTDVVAASFVTGNTIKNITYSSNSTSTLQRLIGLFTGTIQCNNNTIQNVQYTWLGGNVILSAISAGVTTAYQGAVTINNNNINGINFTVAGATSPRYWALYVIDQPSSYTIHGNTIQNINTNINNSIRGIASLSTSVNNSIQNNTISNIIATATGNAVILSGIFTQNNRNHTIQGNTIHNLTTATSNALPAANAAVVGINAAVISTNNNIRLNIIDGLRCTNTTGVSAQAIAICTNTGSGGSILQNRIWDVTNTTTATTSTIAGMYILGGNWTVANNMISLSNGSNSNGLQVLGIQDPGGSGARKYYFNSILVAGNAISGSSTSSCLQYSTAAGASADIKNNLLCMQRSGNGTNVAIANTGTSFSGFVCNNNIENSSNPASLALGPGNQLYNFSSWQMASSGDGNSYTDITVPFVNSSTADLHIDLASLGSTTPTVLESQGTVQVISSDFDNDIRPGPAGSVNGGGSNPDIGADEIDAHPEDKGPVIFYTPISTPNCASDQVINATIIDDTGIPLTGTNVPRLYFRKNSDAWQSVGGVWVSGSASFSNWTFTLSTAGLMPLVSGDIVQYYLIAQDLIAPMPNIGASSLPGLVATDVNNVTTAPGVPDQYSIDLSGGNYWIGINNNWNDGGNWCGGIPGTSSDVTIPAGAAFYPVITTTQLVRQITVDPGAQLSINAPGKLQVYGDFNNNGALINQGTIELNGTGLQQFPGNGAIVAMENIQLKNPVGVQLNKSFNLTGTLTPNAGTLYLNNAVITLKSTASKTASIGVVGGNIQYNGTGNFIVERYIPARRAWRLLAAPVDITNAPTINQAWQESVTPGTGTQDPKPGFGTQITGGTAGNGFDQSPTNNPSIKLYSGSSWTGTVTATNDPVASKITNQQGYMLFVRGDRSIVIAGTNVAPNNTTLRMQGRIKTNQQLINCAGFTVIGNPYPSTINFHQLALSNPGMPDQFYLWDPALGGSYNVGAWVALSWNGTNYTPSVATALSNNGDIASGAAFMVNYNGMLQLDEPIKTAGSSNSLFKVNNSITMSLYAHNADGTQSLNDGVVVIAHETNGDVIPANVVKQMNFTENLGVLKDSIPLAILHRLNWKTYDTIPLTIQQMRPKPYHFQIDNQQLSLPQGSVLLLKDRALQQNTVIPVTGQTNHSFNIQNQGTLSAADRFSLLVQPALDSIGLNGWVQQSTVHLNWQVIRPRYVTGYTIERSVNGSRFDSVSNINNATNTTGTSQYSFTDYNQPPGKYRYRIRYTTQSGTLGYSNTIEFTIMAPRTGWYVYPNPSTFAEANLYLCNPVIGQYRVSVTDITGAIVHQMEWQQGSTNPRSLQLLPMQRVLAAGVYQISVTAPNGKTETQPIIIH